MPDPTVRTVVSPVFGAACHVVSVGRDAVVVDPGAGVADAVLARVAEHDLTVRAVLATHGHPDHTWDAGRLCVAVGVPFAVHEADAVVATDAEATLDALARSDAAAAGVGGALRAAVAASGAGASTPPPDVLPLATPDGEAVLEHGALRVRVLHAPGHTPGSVLYLVGGVVLTGDVLFAGSVGRTDLPGGDPAAMARTLRDVVGQLDAGLTVLPGHGPATTVARELATNPYLRPAP
ncbi:MBL fold metallo-hydrolase [Luteimicrobium album]|uniref:MBL fold metallo-hydrolase n=1 Tax=Luteimicrobium album TaxID=1054550 RepID=A0ABQ6I7Y1_9MICO|nr:MBL fold metallo-hydrolase [Luteimicrobium album]GMA25879.1 MBL fold metallo-hydrolase [Luteimicrobium album]